jgi:hypothetical protein
MAASPLDPFRAVGMADSLTMGQDKKLRACSGDTEHLSLGPAGEEPERIPNNSA